MADSYDRGDRTVLKALAHQAMLDRGLLPDFSSAALAQLEEITGPATSTDLIDLRALLWCSLDNDDSRDLDQLTTAEALSNGLVKVSIAIADVDAIIKSRTALDAHASQNTTSVYTVAQVFPMLPERLSTDITSLNFETDRLAVIIEMTIAPDGSLSGSSLYPAIVQNRARLSYNSVAAWLDGTGPMPHEIGVVKGMEESLRLQDATAQKLKALRHLHGALVLETIETRPVFAGETLMNLEAETRNRAKEIIEDFMIAANVVTAQYLASKAFPSIRRMVRTPQRWDRIIQLAAQKGAVLPIKPDSKALENFLIASKIAEPLRFPDLSLSVIKLLGAGEYIVQAPGGTTEGHFGLAVKDYAHSTAPNRRYPDLITQRLLKAAMAARPVPYSIDELEAFAKHCTEAEEAAKKVERQVLKSAAAILLDSRIGDQFDAIVTGASEKGTWVRIMSPPLEGRLETGFEGLDVGDSLRVQLARTDVRRGFIDFSRA